MTLQESKSTSSPNSIEKLIEKLGNKLHLTGEEIADVLWLILEFQKFESTSSDEKQESHGEDEDSSTSPNNSIQSPKPSLGQTEPDQRTEDKNDTDKGSVYTSMENQGLPIGIPDAPSLRNVLQCARGFQPLMRKIAIGRKVVLDEVATTQRIAKELIWIPVLQAETEQWLDLALVIDESYSMLIWGHTVQDLKKMFKNYGIFRDIRIWGLRPDEAGEHLQFLSRSGKNNRIAEPKEIIDSTGRRVILIVSDCVSNIWRKRMMSPVLKAWTQKQPLVILQMLPEWMWRRTALDLGTAIGFKSSIVGVANQKLSLYKPLRRSRRKGFKIEERSKVPVITLNLEHLTQWSQMLVGKGDAKVPGYLLPPKLEEDFKNGDTSLKPNQEVIKNQNVYDIVDEFKNNTSPLGRKLASLLAASPVISLPVVRLIQESILPKSNQIQVAEVFLGGLLKPKFPSITKLKNKVDLDPDIVEYEFIQPEIRDIFLDDSPVNDSVDVVNAVSRYVAEQLGISPKEFLAILKAPEKLQEENKREDIIKPFAEITAKVLCKLGGEYLKFAEELKQTLGKSQENSNVLEKLKRTISNYEEQIATLEKQFSRTTNLYQKNKLRKRIEEFEKDIEEVVNKLISNYEEQIATLEKQFSRTTNLYQKNKLRKRIEEFEKGIEEVVNRYKSFYTQEKSTIGIITALPKEYAAVKTILENPKDINIEGQGGGRRYLQGEVPSRNKGRHTVVLCLASMGNNIAAIRASLLLNHFPHIRSIVMVGIAGGIPYREKPEDHVRLGDIVVSNERGVIQYDFDKETITENTHRHPPRPPSASLLEGVKYLEVDELMGEKPWLEFIDQALLPPGEKRPPIEDDILVDSNDPTVVIEHPPDRKRKEGEPRVFLGAIASANKLLRNPKTRDELRDKFGVKAVEMEGSGIADATWTYEIGYLVIRGICDYCDSNKGDNWQAYAAAVAAAYTRAILESMPISNTQESIPSPPRSQLGNPSFQLEDDPKIRELKIDIKQLKEEYESLTQQARNSLISVERIRLENQAEMIYNEFMKLEDDQKIRELKIDIKQLEEEYESLTRQARNSLSLVERIRLENQAEMIYGVLESKQKKLKEILN